MSIRSHFDLGFAPARSDDVAGAPPLWLGRRRNGLGLELAVWLLLAIGVFVRQCLTFPPIEWNLGHVSMGSALGSLAIALAVFPAAMRWLNRRRRTLNMEHFSMAFAFGFFLDLVVVAGLKVPESLLRRFLS